MRRRLNSSSDIVEQQLSLGPPDPVDFFEMIMGLEQLQFIETKKINSNFLICHFVIRESLLGFVVFYLVLVVSSPGTHL
jgi:hypothetical protein